MKLLATYLLSIILVNSLNAQNEIRDIDWNNYSTWENTTQFSKTYYVDQKSSLASDNNPGTKELPFLTINKAAQLVKAGEKVVIYAGVYREMIEPLNGGTASDKMIAYEAAPGEKVVIKGSRKLNEKWEQRRVLTDVLPDTSLTYTWSRKVWMTDLPDELFEKNYFPFALPNILPEEHNMMPWAKLVKHRPPYTSKRGMLWQNGKRLLQVENHGDVQRVSGSFWIDLDNKRIHVHTFGNVNPNYELFEVGVQSHLLRPKDIGLGYIHLKGLTFLHCSNGFLRTSTGAVNTKGGHHWIIEDNTIGEINSSCLEFGYFAYEIKDPNPENVQPREDENIGGMIVRNNRIFACGTAGIRSLRVKEARIENNEIWECGWQDAENYWECSGMKILLAHHTLVKGNHVHHIQGGNGIWLDWDNRYSRITGNIIHDVQTIQGGIFLEASQTPNLIDNNFIWDIDGNGIYSNDTDELLVYHNLVANTTGPIIHAVVGTQRKLNGRWLTATNNKIFNNLFVDAGAPMKFDTPENNYADYNLYATTKQPNHAKKSDITAFNLEKHSEWMQVFVYYNPNNQYFIWEAEKQPELVPVLKEVGYDFYGKERVNNMTYPGPFSFSKNKFSLLLSEIPKIEILKPD